MKKNVEEMFNWSKVHSEKIYYLYNRDFNSITFFPDMCEIKKPNSKTTNIESAVFFGINRVHLVQQYIECQSHDKA